MQQTSVIRELFLSSKERCQAHHHLSPGTSRPVLRLQRAEVDERRERFLETIGGFGPELDKASVVPDKGRYCLVISDADGIVVEAYLPDGHQSDFSRHGITMGGVWNEHVAGTNGIDMALRSNRVLTVKGQDHFYRCFQGFACSSAPLHDAESNLLGTITLVGSDHRQASEIAWCEQVLRVAGSRLQASLFRKAHNAGITARLVSHSPDRTRRFETMVACDETGTIRSSVRLWQDGTPHAEHQHLVGRHLSDLRGMAVEVEGPSLVPPRRLVSVPDRHLAPPVPLRAKAGTALARMAIQGGGLDVIVERARKLAAHRVPLLICGEPGVETEDFARALLEEVVPQAPIANCVDCAGLGSANALVETLRQVRFLAEYPIDRLSPVLILLNVERLGPEMRTCVRDFMEDLERQAQSNGHIAVRPMLFFTAGQAWQSLRADSAWDTSLLYLIGQSVVELAPVRDREVGQVLDSVLLSDFSNAVDLSEAAREVLVRYDWPGNLREVRAILREATICGNGKRINVVDLPSRLAEQRDEVSGSDGLRVTLIEALDSTRWNVTRAAALLGKSRATINRWIATENLRRPE